MPEQPKPTESSLSQPVQYDVLVSLLRRAYPHLMTVVAIGDTEASQVAAEIEQTGVLEERNAWLGLLRRCVPVLDWVQRHDAPYIVDGLIDEIKAALEDSHGS